MKRQIKVYYGASLSYFYSDDKGAIKLLETDEKLQNFLTANGLTEKDVIDLRRD